MQVDRDKLYQIVSKHNIPFEFLSDEQITFDNLTKILMEYKYQFLWMCGHGVRGARDESSYALPDAGNQFLASFLPLSLFHSRVLDFCLKSHPASVLICVFDFCHSGAMLSLGYVYFNGRFEKTGAQDANIFGFDKIRIAISAADVKNSTPEDANGGYLTQYLTYLLAKYKYLSLWLIDGEREFSKNSFVIKTNQEIDPKKPFIELV